MKSNSPTDEDVAQAVQDGHTEEFGLIVERYEPKLKRYARKFLLANEDAEDLVQEVFLKAFANIQSFDVKRKFSSWLYRIAHNEFINRIRSRGREPFVLFDIDTLFPHPAAPDNYEENFDRTKTREMLNGHLDKINAKYREPLVLYYFEELNYTEISEVLHIPLSTVGVRLKRARDMLKSTFQEQK